MSVTCDAAVTNVDVVYTVDVGVVVASVRVTIGVIVVMIKAGRDKVAAFVVVGTVD